MDVDGEGVGDRRLAEITAAALASLGVPVDVEQLLVDVESAAALPEPAADPMMRDDLDDP